MKKIIPYLGLLAISIVCIFAFAKSSTARVDEPMAASIVSAPASAEVTVEEVKPDTAPPAPVIDHVSESLKTYILETMTGWQKPDKRSADYASIANDIVTVARSERPIWKNDETHAKSALLLAAVGFWEGSRFKSYVDEGKCNDPAWRKTAIGIRAMGEGGDCDGGWAFSCWQVHDGGGIVLYNDNREWVYAIQDRKSQAFTGPEMIASRQVAARVALHVMRKSIAAGAGLCMYTSELGPCPKSDERLEFMKTYWRKHPFKG